MNYLNLTGINSFNYLLMINLYLFGYLNKLMVFKSLV